MKPKNPSLYSYLTGVRSFGMKEWLLALTLQAIFIAQMVVVQTVNAQSVNAQSVNAQKIAQTVDHHFVITLNPATSQIEVDDVIHLPARFNGQARVHVLLHDGLAVSEIRDGKSLPLVAEKATAEPLHTLQKDFSVPASQYLVTMASGSNTIHLHYHGVINHPLQDKPNVLSKTPGLISKKGIFLSQATLWYPLVVDASASKASGGDALVTFTATITLPQDWKAVTQGKRSVAAAQSTKVFPNQSTSHWEELQPQDDIYLVAGRFTLYQESMYQQGLGNKQAMVFLQRPDGMLAQQYLDATGRYIEMYSKLIGPYAYAKFALVENFWNTGYGMPSFTLLGPQIIRFPFIIYTSYPHEILHNWWGNSVYVDYDHGNWSEGLTAYLADHLLQEQKGLGAQYRRSVLQKYTDYVSSARDFPLKDFRSRHNSATEAVGYGKSLMLFHMLREKLGDAEFIKALQRLYRDYQFKVTSFDDVQHVFSETSGKNLKPWFTQWVQRSGAPDLKINKVNVKSRGKGYTVHFNLQQVQVGDAYQLNIPLAIQLGESSPVYQKTVAMKSKSQNFSIDVPAQPLRLVLDPQFDVFRRLDGREIPAAMSQGFGAEHGLILIPSAAPPVMQQAYRKLAKTWQGMQAGVFEIKLDKDVKSLPHDRAVWLLGWDNRFVPQMKQAVHTKPVTIETQAVTIAGKKFDKSSESVVLAGRNPANPQHTLLWVASDNAKALPGLARKLPHYRKYSFLVFHGDTPNNVAKGQWDVTDSPMWVTLAKQRKSLPAFALKPKKALAELPPLKSSTSSTPLLPQPY